MKYPPATIFSLASLLLPLTTANFDLYWDQSSDGLNPPSDVGMSFFANDPDCNTVEDAYYWAKLGDVSGGKEGVRCKGDGCCRSCDPGEIEVLEMNFHGGDPVYHWSEWPLFPLLYLSLSLFFSFSRSFARLQKYIFFIKGLSKLGGTFFFFSISNQPPSSPAIYRDRNYDMYGLDGKVYGHCFPFPGKEYGDDGGGCGLTFGRREGNRAMRCLTSFTVDDFNAHLPN